MSSNAVDLSLLLMYGRVRRQLNLLVTQLLKPHGIGPKQAVLLRELSELKSASLSTLAERTFTDPAATGRAVDGLIKRGWVKQTDDPNDRRRWLVTLTKQGQAAAQEFEGVFRTLANEFCKPLDNKEKDLLLKLLTQSSEHLSGRIAASKE